MRNVIKSIKTRFPPEREASLRVFFQSYTNSLRTVFSDSFVRFSFFFSFLRLIHRPPPSIQRVSLPQTPLPTHKKCNSSHFLAIVPLGPAFLRPSHTAEFQALKLALTRGPTRVERLCCSSSGAVRAQKYIAA